MHDDRLPVGVSVIVPVYNSESTLATLAAQLADSLPPDSEVIFVDDASRDSSWEIIDEQLNQHPHWVGVQLGRNSGQHAALLAGLRTARYRTSVTMDDDLQHRPDQIHVLLDALTNDVDLVYGRPTNEEHGASRSLASRSIKWLLQKVLRIDHATSIGAFRCFRTHLREAFSEIDDPFVNLDVLLAWGTDRVVAVDVAMERRVQGRSGYSFRRLLKHAMNMISGYSAAPLRIVAYAGILFGVFGIGTLTYVVLRFLFGESTVPGFTFLASLLSIIGAVQMIAIALIGEYLSRIHFRSMRRPAYFIRAERHGGDA